MKNKNIKIVYLTGFLFSIPIALVSYINSSLLEQFVGKNYIGLIYTLASAITILFLLKMPKVLNKFGNRTTAFISSFVIFISFLILAFTKNPFYAITSFITYFVSVSYIIASLDIFIEDFSSNTSTGKMRGIYLTVINTAWIIAQLISGSIINKSSFSGIYLLGSFFILLMAIMLTFFLHDFRDPIYKKIPIRETIKSFFVKKHISKIYLSNLLLQFFYAWMVIYTPIYLHEYINFRWDQIGLIFSIMLLPFIMLNYPLGSLADKIGEKKILKIGFFILAFSVLLMPFIKESIWWIWALILFITRVGAATVETMNEVYFFKIVNEKNASEISFFRNASSVSYVIAPVIATAILALLPDFSYLFFILGVIMLYGLYNSSKLIDIK